MIDILARQGSFVEGLKRQAEKPKIKNERGIIK